MARPWYSLSLEKIFEKLESSDRGLSLEIAKERLKQYGTNSLPEEKPHSKLRLFLSQFQSPLIYILLAASGVVFAMGETVDGSIILAVLLFNAIVGVIQEGKAQNKSALEFCASHFSFSCRKNNCIHFTRRASRLAWFVSHTQPDDPRHAHDRHRYLHGRQRTAHVQRASDLSLLLD